MSLPWPMESLLPHAWPMLLLDDALSHGDDCVATRVTIRPDHPFATSEGVPGHVGIELMAQTCGAWAGLNARKQAEPVRVGYLLGTRRYTVDRSWFRFGDVLDIQAKLLFRDQGMGVFQCRIMVEGKPVAEAQINVYQPDGDGLEVGDA
ncbi:3-hydroxylacyl-ACP dehydratase [Paramagnetospirillum kuznetsovii]|uniref:3-hydroxylacyl-ACP dehydratase n=1 Tax=Paramagnetospirillum kuznetsovii TaxID=2053833 RepID=A0A364NUT6_9PROT|nr:hotdog family protein [Paramagnetospirillum kuznetsovii]RAU20822.1 3-hydroxylacyl-ACP dehydratase [Paramagnetospirillum kuznetsovii]